MSVAKGFRLSDDSTAKLDWNYVTKPDGTKSIIEEVNDVKQDLGDLSELETEDKSSLVNAINEANQHGGSSGSSVPVTVRQAIVDLFQMAIYDQSGAENYIDVLENWANVTVEGISLSPTTLTFNSLSSQTITATIVPADASATITWTSSNPSVATVSNGVVTSVGNGSCTITASAGGVSATCSVTVSGIATTYTVTNTLTGCVTDNALTRVEEGASYSATITPDDGYLLPFVSATITMGGNDITSTAWSDGSISIASVTGAIVITVSATQDTRVLVAKWDFTKSLIDSVDGLEFVLSNSNNGESLPTRDANGLHFTAGEQIARCADYSGGTADGRTIEFDVSSAEFAGDNSKHKRIFGFDSGDFQALIFRNAGQVQIYRNSWLTLTAETGQTIPTSPNAFSGKTVAFKMGTDKTFYFYLDGVLIAKRESWVAAWYATGGLIIGGRASDTASQGNQIHNMTITGLRIYGEASE